MRPRQWIASVAHARHPKIPLPRDLYEPERKNSPGVEFGDADALRALLAEVADAKPARTAQSIIGGKERGGAMRAVCDVVGVTNVLAQCHGPTNPYNGVRATLNALEAGSAPADIAAKRGKSVDEILGA